MGLKTSWVAAHAICVGLILVLDSDLHRRTLQLSWIAASYFVLLALTVVQFFFTVGSSPGYVTEETDSSASDTTPKNSTTGRIASGINPVTIVAAAKDRNGQNAQRTVSDTTPLLGAQQVQGRSSSRANLFSKSAFYCYPNCPFCCVEKPVRTQHCKECQKCVLRFDHHCAILRTCVGQRNHCRFWWFLFFEALFSLWTAINYVSAMNASRAETVVVLVIALGLIACFIFLATFLGFHTYLVVTNQTTFETLKKRRDIPYLQSIPSTVWYPFSKGFLGNVQSFCCTPTDAILDYDPPIPEVDDEAARARSRRG